MAEHSVYAGGKPIRPERMQLKYLSNGSTTNAIGNYGTLEQFKITCIQSSQQLHIRRMLVYYEDVGQFVTNKYGYDLVLANGINIVVRNADDSLVTELNDGIPIQTNSQWSALCYDTRPDDYGAGPNGTLAVRWTFGESGKNVSLSPGQYLAAELQDDFTGLLSHTFMVQGHYA